MEQEDKINIAELLKDAPENFSLWCDAWGDVKYLHNNDLDDIIFVDIKGLKHIINKWGRTAIYSPCIIWPSKDCRTWENFKAPWKYKHFEAFEKVLVNYDGTWMPTLYSFYAANVINKDKHVTVDGASYTDADILKFEGNEDKVGKDAEL